ncbi:2-C-methyl-D-erythritol 4-phosphate cytidylyltransferase [Puniceicoccaceae bacterium K14]|nr:2-C-methyl-D-erythritol 4-phosphate cytidylyltransferase [Puniceicoccaceae bacterium K14]
MSDRSLKVTAILLAGGSGNRMQGATSDKILMPLQGKSIFQYSFDAFQASQAVSHYVIVYRDQPQREQLSGLIPPDSTEVSWTLGGKERHNSVHNGLKACPSDTDVVLIHDCARPLVTPSAIESVTQSASTHGSACIAKKVTDTIKQISPSPGATNTYRLQGLDRSKLWAMETPQAFRYELIASAYESVSRRGQHITDDLSAIEGDQIATQLIENGRPNIKLTTPEDIHFLDFILQKTSNSINSEQ